MQCIMMERSVITSEERENFLGLMWEVLRRGNGVLEDDLLCHFGGGDHGDHVDDADGKAGHLYVAPGPFLITIGEEHGEGSGLGKRIINNFTSTSKRFVN